MLCLESFVPVEELSVVKIRQNSVQFRWKGSTKFSYSIIWNISNLNTNKKEIVAEDSDISDNYIYQTIDGLQQNTTYKIIVRKNVSPTRDATLFVVTDEGNYLAFQKFSKVNFVHNKSYHKQSSLRSSHSGVFLGKVILKIYNKFTVNLLHIFRIPFPRNTSEWLLLITGRINNLSTDISIFYFNIVCIGCSAQCGIICKHLR